MSSRSEITGGQRVELLAGAARAACARITSAQLAEPHVRALRGSIEQACRTPASFGWERKAAAHAEIFNVLADMAANPVTGAVLSSGAGLVYELMITAGRAADGMTASSRERFLACLRTAEWEAASLEMEKHLRVLHYMWRLANSAAHLSFTRAACSDPRTP